MIKCQQFTKSIKPSNEVLGSVRCSVEDNAVVCPFVASKRAIDDAANRKGMIQPGQSGGEVEVQWTFFSFIVVHRRSGGGSMVGFGSSNSSNAKDAKQNGNGNKEGNFEHCWFK